MYSILYSNWHLFICVLQILNAQVTDTGRYVCVAQNLAGSAEKYFNLHVHGGLIKHITCPNSEICPFPRAFSCGNPSVSIIYNLRKRIIT